MIELSNLSFAYPQRETPALCDVSALFKAGQLALVAGESGSGKSTLIRCINGLIPRRYEGGTWRGEVRIDGANIAPLGLAQIAQRVGTVLQDPETQIVAAEVKYDIAFGLENLGLPVDEIERHIVQAAQQVGIAHLLDRSTESLSGGEKQKVAIAGVLAMNPKALVLDEPLASLDPASAREVMQLLRALAASGHAVIVVEHRVKTVLAHHPENIVVMENGAILHDAQDMPRWKQYPQNKKRAPDAAAPPLVELRDVHFAHAGGPRVLNGVSLDVRPGEVIALLGPNGVGKSTLCKHIIGLLRPVQGTVRVEGIDVNAAKWSVAEIAKRVGYVFQSPSFMLFAATVREELAFGPRNIGMDAAAIVDSGLRAARSMGVSELMDRHPFSLSFGQQKRVSIASVLAMRPKLLIMDEPTAGQDHDNIVRFMNDLLTPESVQAVMFATHDLDLVRAYASRAIVMHDGQIAADGPPETVLDDARLRRECRLE